MKNSKKFYAVVILLLVLALALTACGDSATNTAASATTAPAKSVLTTAAATTTSTSQTSAAASTTASVDQTTAANAPKVGNELVGQTYTINKTVTKVVQVFNHPDLTIADIGTIVKPKNGLFLVVKYEIDNTSQVDIYDPFPSVVDGSGKVFVKGADDNKVGSALVSQPQYKFDVPLAAAKKGVMFSIFDVPATATGLQLSDTSGGTKFTSGGAASSNNPAVTAPPAPAASKANTVKGLGLSITFPSNWQVKVDDKDDNGSIVGQNAPSNYISIFRFTKGTMVQGDLKDRAAAVIAYYKSIYADLQVLEEPTLADDDTIRFNIQLTDKNTKISYVEMVLVIDSATINGTYVVEAGSEKSKFDSQKDALVDILLTLDLP